MQGAKVIQKGDTGVLSLEKSPPWGRALGKAIWLDESCWVQLRCFTWKIQILFTESETTPKTAGPLAVFASRIGWMSRMDEQDGWTVPVPGSHLSTWLLLPWLWLLAWSVPHAGEVSLSTHISLRPVPPNIRSPEGSYSLCSPWFVHS